MWYKKKTTEIKAKAIAYYRHSAEDRQENSIPIQRQQVRKFAEEHGIKIVEEFQDAGKSGLSTEKRDGFNEMIKKVISDPDFKYVLALNVSRWGRFQDTSLFPHHQHFCRKYGKDIIFTSIGMPIEDDLSQFLILQLHGYIAAEESRKLHSQPSLEGK